MLRLERVSSGYGRSPVLHEVSLEVRRGEIVALIGSNGAGKSTLLNMVVGLTAPTVGEVSVLGGEPAGSLAALDGIGFVEFGNEDVVRHKLVQRIVEAYKRHAEETGTARSR